MMLICASSRPDPSHDFVGRIGILQDCVMKEAQSTTARHGIAWHCMARHERGEDYTVDVTIDPEY